MTTRDPRLDPQSGDVLESASSKRRRYVFRRDGNDVYYYSRTGPLTAPRQCGITTWQDWARKARVVGKGA